MFLLLFQPTISLATGYGVFVPSRSYDSTDYGIPQSVIEAWLSSGVVIEPVDVSHLEQRVSTNESNISSLQSDLNAIDGRVSTNESNIQDLDARVSALEGGGS